MQVVDFTICKWNRINNKKKEEKKMHAWICLSNWCCRIYFKFARCFRYNEEYTSKIAKESQRTNSCTNTHTHTCSCIRTRTRTHCMQYICKIISKWTCFAFFTRAPLSITYICIFLLVDVVDWVFLPYMQYTFQFRMEWKIKSYANKKKMVCYRDMGMISVMYRLYQPISSSVCMALKDKTMWKHLCDRKNCLLFISLNRLHYLFCSGILHLYANIHAHLHLKFNQLKLVFSKWYLLNFASLDNIWSI